MAIRTIRPRKLPRRGETRFELRFIFLIIGFLQPVSPFVCKHLHIFGFFFWAQFQQNIVVRSLFGIRIQTYSYQGFATFQGGRNQDEVKIYGWVIKIARSTGLGKMKLI